MSRSAARECAGAIITRSSWPNVPDGLPGKASDLFQKMQRANPSPYEFLIQFGGEQLVGASPEMFVRVEANASKPVRSRVPRGVRAIRCRTKRISATCSIRPKKSPS